MSTQKPKTKAKRIPIAIVDKTGAVLPFPRGRTLPDQYYEKVKFFLYTQEEVEEALVAQQRIVEAELVEDFEDPDIAIERVNQKESERLDMRQARSELGLL